MKRTRKRAEVIASEEAKWTVAGVRVRRLATRCWKALKKTGHASPRKRMPELYIKRRRLTAGRGTSGYAWSHGTVQLFIDIDCDVAAISELVLHELTHHAVGVGKGHGLEFNGALADAAHELWGYPGGGGEGYSGSTALKAWLRANMNMEPE